MNWIRNWVRKLSDVDEVALAFRCLDARRESGVMIDVGAHRGGSLDQFAAAGWTVHAFEPDPRNQGALRSRWGGVPGIYLNSCAVGTEDSDAVSFAVADNSYIGSLTSFDASHENTITVRLQTLATYCREHAVNRVDFLKIDAEGHDLDVLRGFPWDVVKPRLVLCEFEDRKQGHSEFGFKAMADFLTVRGYQVLVSEWKPIVSYGGPFHWRRFFGYPGDFPYPAGNGNILAVRSDSDFRRLRLLAAWNFACVSGSQRIRSAYRAFRRVLSR